MLEVSNVQAGYGNLQVLRGIDFHVQKGELVSVLGTNGAGKTTLLQAISGLHQLSGGTITFEGERIDHLQPHQIVERGLIQVPEGRKLFTEMNVLENLELGAFTKEARKKFQENLEWVYELFPILLERKGQLVGSMSGGQQQMVAIARGLMSCPKLLILDEPSIGLSPLLTKQVFEIIKKIKDHDVTVLLVEQNAYAAMELSDRGYVIENGRIVMSGAADELLNNDELKAAYLGM
ncbi:ABC transporter ATP-binding protein [Aneurinibacillus sp. REN35]|uniref:ABC transporter ATP-binding protein n=1 Tax=Aneurinibacillus sp. REN35 TaxID=3237286 RepID=UPI0035287AAE